MPCYSQVTSIYVYFRLLCQTAKGEVPPLNRYEKVTCENCGTQTKKPNLASDKKRVSVGIIYCTHFPNFSTKSQNDLNYHIAKKHSGPKPDITFECKHCFQEFPGFYALRQPRNIQHGMQIGSGTRDVVVEHRVGDIEYHRLREKLRSCQHSWWIRNLKERDTKYSIAQWKLSTKIVNEKLDLFFNNLKGAAKVNLVSFLKI